MGSFNMSTISYQRTKIACYLGYVTQAISINLLPLLYVMMQEDFSISLTQLGLLATIVFAIQIIVDLLAARFGHYLSFRVGCVAAHAFASVGLALMSFLPHILPHPYTGVVIAAVLLSIGGGLTEVLISPVVDAIPSEQKAGQMSLLHSFYCWGVVAVSLLSTLFFAVVGAAFWRWLLLLWATVPVVTMVMFMSVPLPAKPEEKVAVSEHKMRWSGSFCLMLALMICAGVTELGLAQWASLFMERGFIGTLCFCFVPRCIAYFFCSFFLSVSAIAFVVVARHWLHYWLCGGSFVTVAAFIVVWFLYVRLVRRSDVAGSFEHDFCTVSCRRNGYVCFVGFVWRRRLLCGTGDDWRCV